jgi:hypothetical protein
MADIDVFYGSTCTRPYIKATASLTAAGGSRNITETGIYVDVSGAPLGTLRLNEVAAEAASGIDVHGTGTFSPHDGAPVVSLGLTCKIPDINPTPPFVCSGGIAQSFPALGLSLASVTPLTLKVTSLPSASDKYSVAFTSTHSEVETGAPGSLSVVTPTPTTFGIAGKAKDVASDTTSGRASLFALFPPPPTGWQVTNPADKATFSINLQAGTSQTLVGSVKSGAGSELAHLTVDQSGTGTISYAGGKTAPVTSWTLGG